MMKYLNLIALILLLCSFNSQKNLTIKSPDGKTKVQFSANNKSLGLSYLVMHAGKTIILPSQLGFQLKGGPAIGKNFKIVSVEESSANKIWKPVYGERSEIRDNYNQAKILLKETSNPERELEIIFRAYNEGVAFNYTFLPQNGIEKVTIKKELTQFSFEKNYECWVSDRAQSEYRKEKINSIKKPAERPLVVESGDIFVALGEAKLIDFARMKFTGGKENSLNTALHGEATVSLPYTTPWRTIMIGNSAGELLENNFIIENLNNECAIENVKWIKPGKVIREVTLTTTGGLACVDFAAENGLQYVEFDAGWYGNEYDDKSDATTITVDPKRSPGPLDLHKVIEYAKSKNIGIIVYVNRRALEKQLDEVLPLLKEWGIAGVKYGFVQVGSQEWTTWLHDAIKKAAKYELMVDVHDEYRPTGFSRTYPNFITQEGIRGDEESPSNEHTLITLFTRMIAGAGDNTNCYYAPRVTEKMGGHVSQLAKAVMLYSPWQFLYWYDRPQGSPGKKGGAGSAKGYIQNDPELEWFKNLPVVWDETKVLEGEIGKYATVARKSGNDWFLGSLTGNVEQTLKFKPDFLNPDEKYKATVYSYDPESKSTTKVKIETIEIESVTELKFDIVENSGLAVYFKKMKATIF